VLEHDDGSEELYINPLSGCATLPAVLRGSVDFRRDFIPKHQHSSRKICRVSAWLTASFQVGEKVCV